MGYPLSRRESGGLVVGRGNQDGRRETGIRSSVSTCIPATIGCSFRRAGNGTVARTCRVIPRHMFVDGSCMAFSKNILWDTTLELAANSAISLSRAKAAGPARRNVSWRGESACTRAGAAVLVPFKRVLPFCGHTYVTRCGLESGGRQRVRHT